MARSIDRELAQVEQRLPWPALLAMGSRFVVSDERLSAWMEEDDMYYVRDEQLLPIFSFGD